MTDILGTGLLKRLEGRGLTARVFPVFDLRKGAATTLVCATARKGLTGHVFGHALLQGLDEQSLAAIDNDFLQVAIGYAERLAAAKVTAAVGTVAAFSTLANSRTRIEYLQLLRKAALPLNPVIVKVELVHPGTPTQRLAEIVSYLKSADRRVMMTMPEKERTWAAGTVNASALGINLAPTDGADDVRRKAGPLLALCAAQNAVSFADGFVAPGAVQAAIDAGIRFGAGSALSDASFTFDGPLPTVPLPAKN